LKGSDESSRVFDPPFRGGPLVLAVAICLLLDASAYGGREAASTTKPVTIPASMQRSRPSRCRHVPQALVTRIARRLTAQETLRNARAVKSGDLTGVWFISGEIDGPGLGKRGDIGTWAKVGPLATSGGLILAVDTVFAQELSGWPGGDATYVDLTMDTDGAQKSHDCVKSG
jgi:hypothetical protein